MVIDQSQDNYETRIKKLHFAKKKAKDILTREQSEQGKEIVKRYIDTCRYEIMRLRAEHIFTLPMQPDHKNFYPPNIGKKEYDYFINFNNGILSAPMNYDEFMERMNKNKGAKRMERYLGEPDEQ